jgi:hypothetical protein
MLRRLIRPQLLTTTPEIFYQVPDYYRSVAIYSIIFCNTSSSSVTVNVNMVESGLTADIDNFLFKDFQIDANDTKIIDLSQGQFAINLGDMLIGSASDDAVVVHLTGEYTFTTDQRGGDFGRFE